MSISKKIYVKKNLQSRMVDYVSENFKQIHDLNPGFFVENKSGIINKVYGRDPTTVRKHLVPRTKNSQPDIEIKIIDYAENTREAEKFIQLVTLRRIKDFKFLKINKKEERSIMENVNEMEVFEMDNEFVDNDVFEEEVEEFSTGDEDLDEFVTDEEMDELLNDNEEKPHKFEFVLTFTDAVCKFFKAIWKFIIHPIKTIKSWFGGSEEVDEE